MTNISINDLYNMLEGIDNEKKKKEQEILSEAPNYQKLEYSAPSDDELQTIAQNYLKDKYDLKRKTETENTNTKIDNLKKLIDEEKLKEQEKIDESDKNYKKSSQKVDDELIKRGIQRSSIAIGEIGNLEKQKIADQNKIKETTQKNIADFDAEILALTQNLDKAISDYNMAEANEISQKLYELKEDRRKNQESVAKFNNDVESKMLEYNLSYQPKNIQKKVNESNLEFEKQKINQTLSYYYSIPDPQQAYEEFKKDTQLRVYLGDNYEVVRNILRSRG